MSEVKEQREELEKLLGTKDYSQLAKAFTLAFNHAANPTEKGSQRHSLTDSGRIPFTHQAITVLPDMFGIIGSLYYQAAKKLQESQRMEPQAAIQELRGAMVYIATAMVKLDKDAGGDLL